MRSHTLQGAVSSKIYRVFFLMGSGRMWTPIIYPRCSTGSVKPEISRLKKWREPSIAASVWCWLLPKPK